MEVLIWTTKDPNYRTSSVRTEWREVKQLPYKLCESRVERGKETGSRYLHIPDNGTRDHGRRSEAVGEDSSEVGKGSLT